MLDSPGGGGRGESNGEISKPNRILDFFKKYRTVGGVIWLGDPALVARRAEWRGLTSCLRRGWLRAEEELREGERGREGERRQAVKDEGK